MTGASWRISLGQFISFAYQFLYCDINNVGQVFP